MSSELKEPDKMSSEKTEPDKMSLEMKEPDKMSEITELDKIEKISSETTEPDKMSSELMEPEKRSSKLMVGEDNMQDIDEKCNHCDVCKANRDEQTTRLSSASKRCQECEQNLCSRCIGDHLRQKMLRNHHIVDIPCQLEEEASESSHSNALSGCVEPTPCEDRDSANVSCIDIAACLSTSHAQSRISGPRIRAQLEKERDRVSGYGQEISSQIDRLLKGQEDTKTEAEKTKERIRKRHAEYVARLDSDTKSLLEQLDSITAAKSSEIESQIQEGKSYLKKLIDHTMNLQEILERECMEANEESITSYDLFLHIYIKRSIPSLDLSFQEFFPWDEAKNLLGRLEEQNNTSKLQTESAVDSYTKFLSNVHGQIADARESYWKVTIPYKEEIERLHDQDFLQRVRDKLGLSKTDRKWEDLQTNHVKMASLLFELTRPTSESSSKELESLLTELQSNITKVWNMIQFHIRYKNSEKGLMPKGLKNHGNTCYFNSVMQCLFQTVLLPFELTLNLYGLGNVLKDFTLSEACMELAFKYSESEERPKALVTLYKMFTSVTPRFNNQRQHDSHDLLIHFLDTLRVEERNVWKSQSDSHETQKMLTVVDRIFGGQFITVYTCHSCKEPYAIREPFLDISLPLCTLSADEKKLEQSKGKTTTSTESSSDQTSEQQKSLGTSDAESQQRPLTDDIDDADYYSSCEVNHFSSPSVDNNSNDSSKREVIKKMLELLTVEPTAEAEAKSLLSLSTVFDFFNKTPNPNVSQCLKYFTRAEEIDNEYLCRQCQPQGREQPTMTSATKRTLISSPPAVLVLHLKRFEQTKIGFVKRDVMIPYEELLDLGPFCSCSALRVDPEEENVWYSLYAVVVHCGFFLSQGHYIAYVKERDSSAQLEDQVMEKFLQKNCGEREPVPNDSDVETMEKRKRITNRKKAERPGPITGQWYYISDELVRPCDAKEAFDQKAFLLFYERIPGIDRKNTGV